MSLSADREIMLRTSHSTGEQSPAAQTRQHHASHVPMDGKSMAIKLHPRNYPRESTTPHVGNRYLIFARIYPAVHATIPSRKDAVINPCPMNQQNAIVARNRPPFFRSSSSRELEPWVFVVAMVLWCSFAHSGAKKSAEKFREDTLSRGGRSGGHARRAGSG